MKTRPMTKRQKALVAVLVIAAMVILARFGGASWQGILWGILGLAAFSAVASFFEWLLHWRPDRRGEEASPAPERRADPPE